MQNNFPPNYLNGIKAGFRFAIAGLFAFLFYRWFDLKFGYWAVVSVSAVMQPNVAMTGKKCLLRLLGTLIGVAIGYLGVISLTWFPHALYFIFFCAMFLTGWLIFKNKKLSYMGIVCGITIIIIITTYNETPALYYNVIVNRTLDVMTGIIIAWLCSLLIFPIKHEQTIQTRIRQEQLSESTTKLALIMASATTISLIPWFSLHYSGGFWAPIACLFIIEENIDKTQSKGYQRFFAHVIVLIITSILSFSLNSAYGLGITLFIGMFIFGFWMENPLFGLGSSVANTMAIAYCIVLLLSPGEENTIHTVLARFLNTIIGIAIGMIIVNIIQRRSPSSKRRVN